MVQSCSIRRLRRTGRTRLVRGLGLGLLAGVLAAPVLASEREHGAHEHGVGQLNVAVEGAEVEIELIAPGADIVGFEHEAETEADKAAVAKAAALLADGPAIFVFPDGAACALEEAEVESAMLEDEHAHEEHAHEEHAHEEHAHEEHADEKHGDEEHGHEEHAHEKHGDEEHAHEEHAGEEGESHSEFHAHYHFECGNPGALEHIEVRYFEHFPNAEELDVQTITDSGQGAQELTAEATRLDL